MSYNKKKKKLHITEVSNMIRISSLESTLKKQTNSKNINQEWNPLIDKMRFLKMGSIEGKGTQQTLDSTLKS